MRVVYGVQISRKGDSFERWTGTWFYRIFNSLTGLALPENIVVARLMTSTLCRRVAAARGTRSLHGRPLADHGLCPDCHPVVKHSRAESTYSLKHKVELLVNSVTSFSNIPLYAIFYFGATISLLASIGSVYIIASGSSVRPLFSGWTSVMASIWLIGGLIILLRRDHRNLPKSYFSENEATSIHHCPRGLPRTP